MPGQYVSDIRSGNRSIFNENIVDAGSGLQSLEVIINSGAGAIEGMVENIPTGSRRSDARVLLVPEDSKIQNRFLYRTAVIQESGAFAISPDVPPGDYRIVAISRLPIGHPEWNAEFLKKYADVTIPISVLPGQSNPFRLRLVPAR